MVDEGGGGVETRDHGGEALRFEARLIGVPYAMVPQGQDQRQDQTRSADVNAGRKPGQHRAAVGLNESVQQRVWQRVGRIG